MTKKMQENKQNVKRIPVASGLQPAIPDSKRGATRGFLVASGLRAGLQPGNSFRDRWLQKTIA
jgi:hypothetical protein